MTDLTQDESADLVGWTIPSRSKFKRELCVVSSDLYIGDAVNDVIIDRTLNVCLVSFPSHREFCDDLERRRRQEWISN